MMPILKALLGPTNTGKTSRALDRMLTHTSGLMGFPLRLLARENYERACTLQGRANVALITGEEKIISPHARFVIATVEAMPVNQPFDFVGIDEIQLAADPERGHVFTDRLFHTRGLRETLFLGSDTMAPILAHFFPDIIIETAPRLSPLTDAGHTPLGRLPARTAVIAFGVHEVYAIAEAIRQKRGGAAIVLGALSPRTRNAQVDLFQTGDVDMIVATDAIGMGLNLDIHHVAFSGRRKFDGRRMRGLTPAELGQIAGRAGRGLRPGTFGTTHTLDGFSEELSNALSEQTFARVDRLVWRASDLSFASPQALLQSLERPSPLPELVRGHTADDHRTLRQIYVHPVILDRARTPDRVRLLWDVCQIPDFRKTMTSAHDELILDIFSQLTRGRECLEPLGDDWLQAQIDRLNRTDGDIDTLTNRLAYIRTLTTITHRAGWVTHADEWQARTASLEDNLSDALHQALIRRFVDTRSHMLFRLDDDALAKAAAIDAAGSVRLHGIIVGQMQGFSFRSLTDDPAFNDRGWNTVLRKIAGFYKQAYVMDLSNALPTQFLLNDQGIICFQRDATNPLPGDPLARLIKGSQILDPAVALLDDGALQDSEKNTVVSVIQKWVAAHIHTILAPLIAVNAHTDSLPPPVRGICFQLVESFGVCPRAQIDALAQDLTPDMRKLLRERGVRLGPVLVFMPALNKPASVRLRALLWAIDQGWTLPAPTPRDGSVSVPVDPATAHTGFYQSIGYPVYGPRAIRIDMLDRVISAVYDSAQQGRFRPTHMMAEWLGCSIPDLYAVLEAMGHRRAPAALAPNPVPEMTPEQVADPSSETMMDGVAIPEAPAPSANFATKPELDLFLLKRGKADQSHAPRPAPARITTKDSPPQKRGEERSFAASRKKNKKEQRVTSPSPRSFSAPAHSAESDDSSPFAVLKKLKI